MKHFLVEVTYTAPLEVIDETLAAHRAFLQTGYDRGWLLASGPQAPRVGGVVIARAPSLEELQRFFEDDPYRLKDAAQYRFVEFVPVKHQTLLKDWVEGQ